MELAPLPVVLPLLAAALVIGLGRWLSRRWLDIIACATTAAVLGICVRLVIVSQEQPIAYWFGDWQPAGPAPVGIAFVVDPLGAGMAAVVSLLMLAALVFSWSYFESIKALYHALMLAFFAAMCGMCLTGDLFNLFVWFELMTVAGVALCGYKAEETGPVQGALNYQVTNMIGAILSLNGLALVYAQVGALNLAEMQTRLAQLEPGGLFVPAAFLLLIAGFLVKSAAVPFHLWLADAHAVAPTPVCVLFSGVMVELGLFAVLRIYWDVFAPSLAENGGAVRALFIGMGALSALFGAAACFGQRHFKRLLAFSTISHVGIMMMGVGLLDAAALAGAALYFIGHACVKGALFLIAGVLLHRFHSVDEYDLKGAGRRMPWIGVLMLLAVIGLAGIFPFATAIGERTMDTAAARQEQAWIGPIAACAEALTAAALLRAGGRIFLGVGQKKEETMVGAPHIPMQPETEPSHRRTPATMWLPTLILLLAAVVPALWPDFRAGVAAQAVRFQMSRARAAWVLRERPLAAPRDRVDAGGEISIWRPILVVGAAVLLAAAALFSTTLANWTGTGWGKILRAGMDVIRGMQSGKIGDYVAWFAFGLAAYGAWFLYHFAQR